MYVISQITQATYLVHFCFNLQQFTCTIVEVRIYCVAMWRPSWILAAILISKLGSRSKMKD